MGSKHAALAHAGGDRIKKITLIETPKQSNFPDKSLLLGSLIPIILIPFIIYLNYSANLPQTLDLSYYEGMPLAELLLALGVLYLPLILGLYAVLRKSTLTTAMFASIMLGVAALPTELKLIETIVFSLLLLWFIELNYTSKKLAKLSSGERLIKPYILQSSILLIPIALLSVAVLKFSAVLSLLSPKFGESIELASIYGTFIAVIIIFGLAATVKLWKK